MNRQFLIKYTALIGIIVISFIAGYSYKGHEVIQNAQKVFKTGKTTFEVQDIEIIIFGEPQL